MHGLRAALLVKTSVTERQTPALVLLSTTSVTEKIAGERLGVSELKKRKLVHALTCLANFVVPLNLCTCR